MHEYVLYLGATHLLEELLDLHARLVDVVDEHDALHEQTLRAVNALAGRLSSVSVCRCFPLNSCTRLTLTVFTLNRASVRV